MFYCHSGTVTFPSYFEHELIVRFLIANSTGFHNVAKIADRGGTGCSPSGFLDRPNLMPVAKSAVKKTSTSAPKRKKPIEQYDHRDKQRVNNPPVGIVDATSDAAEGKKRYAYDPHLDPSLQWAGKAERTSFEIPTVSLHVHERIDPRSILEAVRKKKWK